MVDFFSGAHKAKDSDFEALKRLIYLCNVEGKYYCGGPDRNKPDESTYTGVLGTLLQYSLKKLLEILEQAYNDPNLPYKVQVFNIISTLITLPQATEDKKPLISALAEKLCKSDKELFTFIRAVVLIQQKANKKVPTTARKSIVRYYRKKDAENLAKSYVVHKSYCGWKHKDIIKFFRLKSDTLEKNLVINYILFGGKSSEIKFKLAAKPSEATGQSNVKVTRESDAATIKSDNGTIKSKEAHVGLDELLGESSKAPGETDEVPVESDEVPVESVEVPVESEEVPVESEEVPVESEEVPVESVEVRVESEEVHVESDEVPVESEEVTVESEEVPVESEEVPVESEEVPVESDEVPVESDEVPSELDELLSASDEVSRVSEDVRRESGVVKGHVNGAVVRGEAAYIIGGLDEIEKSDIDAIQSCNECGKASQEAKEFRKAMESAEKETKPLLDLMKKSDTLRRTKDPKIAVPLIEELKASIEQVEPGLRKSAEVWNAVLPHMAMQEILQSLTKLYKLGFLKKESPTEFWINKILTDEFKVTSSGVHPIEVFIFMKIFERGGKPLDPQLLEHLKIEKNLSDEEFEKLKKRQEIRCPTVFASLQKCMNIACEKVTPTRKRYLITVDTTDKMDTNCVGCKNLTGIEAASAFVWFFLKVEKEVTVAFFNDNEICVLDLDKMSNLYEHFQKFRDNKSKYLVLASPITWAIEQKKNVDVFINFIHHKEYYTTIPKEIRDKMVSPVECLESYRQKMNLPDAKLVTFCLSSPKMFVAQGKRNVLDIAGLDTGVPKVLEAFCRNTFQ